MIEQNTDQMFFMIGAVVIFAMLIGLSSYLFDFTGDSEVMEDEVAQVAQVSEVKETRSKKEDKVDYSY